MHGCRPGLKAAANSASATVLALPSNVVGIGIGIGIQSFDLGCE